MQYGGINQGPQPNQGIKNSPPRKRGAYSCLGVTGEVATITMVVAVVGSWIASLTNTGLSALAVATAMTRAVLGH